MQIIQIADLHITQTTDVILAKKKIDRLFASVETELSKSEQIILCLLGDIIDKGDANSYSTAREVITYLAKKFKNFSSFSIECLPGNHDLCGCPYDVKPKPCPSRKCSLEPFFSFCDSINAGIAHSESVSVRKYESVDLIIANSVYDSDCFFGALDCEKLTEIDSTKPVLILTHHTFLSDNSADSSVIRNGYEFFKTLETKNVIGILHGHTHGYKNITIEEKCKIIGVGPFLKEIQDINNQFNLIFVDTTGIAKIVNFAYRADRDAYNGEIVFVRKNDGIYIGSDVDDLYGLIVKDTKLLGAISNLVIKLSMPINSFCNQIETSFPDQICVAKDWQSDEVPENLYYNHGSYMKVGDRNGIDFIIKELTAKATSSRALIPLISFEKVVESGDDFLPSFDIVQFGFDDDSKTKLTISLYMRALEVNHFLRINLCELYVLVKTVQENIRSIQDVDVNIFAFRAQYKEKFGCFAKAKLDITSESKLFSYLINNDVYKIVDLLREKNDFSETVVKNDGINKLYSAFKTLFEEGKIEPNLMTCMDDICKSMRKLEEERKKTSNYIEIDKTEEAVHNAISILITKLNKDKGIVHDTK